MPLHDEEALYITDSLIMFISYISIGSLPLLIVVIGNTLFANTVDHVDLFLTTVAIGNIFLFILGVMKSFFSSSHWLYSGFEGLGLGLLCCVIGYFVGTSVLALVF